MAGNGGFHDEDNFFPNRRGNRNEEHENVDPDLQNGAVAFRVEINENRIDYIAIPEAEEHHYLPSIASRMEVIREENVIEEMLSLTLVGYEGSSLNGVITRQFINLMDVNLHGVQLTTLEGFPALPNLRRLDLSLNLLYDGFELLLNCRLLQFLDISQNLIHNFDDLLPLRNLRILQYLCVLPRRLRAPDEFHDRLPDAVFNSLVHLQYLDMRDRNGTEIEMKDIEEDLGFKFV